MSYPTPFRLDLAIMAKPKAPTKSKAPAKPKTPLKTKAKPVERSAGVRRGPTQKKRAPGKVSKATVDKAKKMVVAKAAQSANGKRPLSNIASKLSRQGAFPLTPIVSSANSNQIK
jgi:hypothetical protein